MYLVSLSKCLDKIHTLEFNRSAQSKSRDASDMFFQLERVLFEPSGFHGRVGGSIHDPVATAGATQRARNVRRRSVVSHSLTQAIRVLRGPHACMAHPTPYLALGPTIRAWPTSSRQHGTRSLTSDPALSIDGWF